MPGVHFYTAASFIEENSNWLTAIVTVILAVVLAYIALLVGAAVLIDATLVRSVLVPASMKLLGNRNWYLPKWLDWLPHGQEPEFPRAGPGELRPHPDTPV